MQGKETTMENGTLYFICMLFFVCLFFILLFK